MTLIVRFTVLLFVVLLHNYAAHAQVFTGFTLIRPPDTSLGPVPGTINLAVVGPSLNIKAETTRNAAIDNVVFSLDGIAVATERKAPYTVGGDTNGMYDTYAPLAVVGTHFVEAEAYDGNNKLLGRSSINFTVAKDSAPKPSPVTVPAPTKRSVFIGFNVLTMNGGKMRKSKLTEIVDVSSSEKYTSIEAVTSPDSQVDRVSFTFDGKFVNSEGSQPWTLNGFAIFQPITIAGQHTLTVAALALSGSIMESRSISFTTIAAAPVTSPVVAVNPPTPSLVIINGELRKWHKVTLAFTGPFASETSSINPFMDYRFDVEFVHAMSGKRYKVPGYFAADGNAAETSASSGDQWYCHFAPDEVGVWTFVASFVTGIDIAVSTIVGESTAFHGVSGEFTILETNKTGRDHRGKGRLQYVGEHHLQYQETGEWFLKAGADSPENFLAYDDFDNTPNIGGNRKSWSPHLKHFNASIDPIWQTSKGKGIVGAINYLSNKGMNTISFLTMNIEGDDKNVFPYISSTNVRRMDVSKLAQWEIVFGHADKMGMFLHVKMFEQENDQLLDSGSLGKSRMLYYRELIARFGHHLALCWNLAEEVTNTVPQIKQFSEYIKKIDPYQHIVVTHTYPDSHAVYNQLIGYPDFDGPSLQQNPGDVFDVTLRWVEASAAAKQKWIVTNDEQNPAADGVVPDSEDSDHNNIRQSALWGNIMAGGSGVAYYFGYDHDDSDLSCENFASRNNMWDQSRYALEFFRNHDVPFWDMSNNDVRLNYKDWLLSSSDGTIHVIYRRSISRKTDGIRMDGLPGGAYTVQWYNPRSGGPLQNGSVATITSNTTKNFVSFGDPPGPDDGEDWVILIKRT